MRDKQKGGMKNDDSKGQSGGGPSNYRPPVSAARYLNSSEGHLGAEGNETPRIRVEPIDEKENSDGDEDDDNQPKRAAPERRSSRSESDASDCFGDAGGRNEEVVEENGDEVVIKIKKSDDEMKYDPIKEGDKATGGPPPRLNSDNLVDALDMNESDREEK